MRYLILIFKYMALATLLIATFMLAIDLILFAFDFFRGGKGEEFDVFPLVMGGISVPVLYVIWSFLNKVSRKVERH